METIEELRARIAALEGQPSSVIVTDDIKPDEKAPFKPGDKVHWVWPSPDPRPPENGIFKEMRTSGKSAYVVYDSSIHTDEWKNRPGMASELINLRHGWHHKFKPGDKVQHDYENKHWYSIIREINGDMAKVIHFPAPQPESTVKRWEAPGWSYLMIPISDLKPGWD